MKPIFLWYSVAILLLAGCSKPADNQSINPVLGDVSYIEKFGHSPDSSTNETERIQTHLQYVETLLRSRDVSHLSMKLRQQRALLLDYLNEYRLAGNFPRNYDYPGRRIPCFIDKDGSICAVGYLVEMTAGRKAAEEINSKFKYENLLAMNDENLDRWIEGSGLTKEECAMIQPAYGFYPQPNTTIRPAYGVSSAILGGVNISMMTLNGVQIGRSSNDKIIPIIGLATGIGQIALGAGMFPPTIYDMNGSEITNNSERALSYVNIGMGTSTFILSAWNLFDNFSKKRNRTTSFSGYAFPTPDNNFAAGIYFSKRF